jgi:hypothetical protein
MATFKTEFRNRGSSKDLLALGSPWFLTYIFMVSCWNTASIESKSMSVRKHPRLAMDNKQNIIACTYTLIKIPATE